TLTWTRGSPMAHAGSAAALPLPESEVWQIHRSAPARLLAWAATHPKLVVFSALVVAMFILAIAAPVLSPYEPTTTAPAHALAKPSSSHLLGTDNLGRDTFTRVLYGARISFRVGLLAVAIALTFGVSFGLMAGYAGGLVDQVLSRIIDAQLAFPGVL